MKWFKHYTNASDDEFIARLEDEFGLEGYARWWKLLEVIAQNMGGESGCSATYPWSHWQRFLKGKRRKLEPFLAHLESKGRIKRKQTGNKPETNRKQTGNEPEMNSKRTGNILEIECRKLLQIKDEYSRKSGQTPDMCPDNVPPKSKEIRVKKKEEHKNTLSDKSDHVSSETQYPTTQEPPKPKPAGQDPPKPPGLKKEKLREEFAVRWQRYRGVKDGKKGALGHWNASVKTQEDLADYDKAEQNYYAFVQSDRANGFPDRKYKLGKTWFNNWRDYIDQEPQATPRKKPKDGIFPAPQLDQEELKSKIEIQVAFVREELAEGAERNSIWLRLALGKFVEEYQARFGKDPLSPDEREWFLSLKADLEGASHG